MFSAQVDVCSLVVAVQLAGRYSLRMALSSGQPVGHCVIAQPVLGQSILARRGLVTRVCAAAWLRPGTTNVAA